MKIFIDTANIQHIKEMAFIADGVTTNPSLIAKEGRDFKTVVKEITEIVDGPISAEVISLKKNEMVAEAKEIAKIHKNIVIKIPMTQDGIAAVKELSKIGIKTNVTLVFSANQALLAAKAGASFVSPFVGRLDDIGQDGMQLIQEIVDIYGNYDFKTEVLVASVRHPIHVIQAARMGADVATIHYDVLKKMFNHSLTDLGIKKFLEDWEKVPKMK